MIQPLQQAQISKQRKAFRAKQYKVRPQKVYMNK